jgi:uncharacterized membrane protein YgaE (UPF0421/DUF939 family)
MKLQSHFRATLSALINSNVLIYSLKCAIGFLVGFSLYAIFPQYEVNWAILSIILVLSPEDKEAKRLALERMKANLIGSVIAVVLFFFHEPNLQMMIIGALLVIAVCYLFGLLNVSRTALATLIIILLYEQEKTSWIGAAERLICVVGGCLIGLGITLVVESLLEWIRHKWHFSRNVEVLSDGE